MALVHQSGGGTGFSFSRLRPKNDIVRSTMGVASGPGLVHEPVRRVHRRGQAGRHPPRRQHGHPAGRPPGHPRFHHLQGRHHQDHQLQHLGGGHRRLHGGGGAGRGVRPDPSEDPQGRRASSRRATSGSKIIHGAWKTGEPGVFFIDRANHYNPVPHLGSLRGDQSLRRAAAAAVRRLQPRLDQRRVLRQGRADGLGAHAPGHPPVAPTSSRTSSTPTTTRCRRSTSSPSGSAASGSGVMGLADLLVRLGIAYDTDEGVELGRRIMAFVDEEAKVESERLATQRGAFPEWERSIWGPDATCARDAQGKRDPPDAAAAQLQRHHRRADRHDLHHRRLQLGHRAAVRRGVHAQPGRRADARRERGLRRDREARGLVLRRADEADRRGGPHPLPRGAGEVAARVRHGQRHQAGVAHPDAGGVPGAQRQRHLQDLQLRQRRHRGVRRGDLPAGVRARAARASRSTATAAATCRCSPPAPRRRRWRSRRPPAASAEARADLAA